MATPPDLMGMNRSPISYAAFRETLAEFKALRLVVVASAVGLFAWGVAERVFGLSVLEALDAFARWKYSTPATWCIGLALYFLTTVAAITVAKRHLANVTRSGNEDRQGLLKAQAKQSETMLEQQRAQLEGMRATVDALCRAEEVRDLMFQLDKVADRVKMHIEGIEQTARNFAAILDPMILTRGLHLDRVVASTRDLLDAAHVDLRVLHLNLSPEALAAHVAPSEDSLPAHFLDEYRLFHFRANGLLASIEAARANLARDWGAARDLVRNTLPRR